MLCLVAAVFGPPGHKWGRHGRRPGLLLAPRPWAGSGWLEVVAGGVGVEVRVGLALFPSPFPCPWLSPWQACRAQADTPWTGDYEIDKYPYILTLFG